MINNLLLMIMLNYLDRAPNQVQLLCRFYSCAAEDVDELLWQFKKGSWPFANEKKLAGLWALVNYGCEECAYQESRRRSSAPINQKAGHGNDMPCCSDGTSM